MGLTQKALAQQAGVDCSMITYLERGARDGSIHLWDRLEDILDAPQRWLRETDEDRRQKASRLWFSRQGFGSES